MNIEQLDKSMSYQSLESARRLADEMKQQASDYAKEAGHGRGLYLENHASHIFSFRIISIAVLLSFLDPFFYILESYGGKFHHDFNITNTF